MENKPENVENSEPWYLNKMKKVNTQTLENTIAKALGDLTGLKYECWVSQIDYEKPSGLQSCSFSVAIKPKDD